MSVAAIVLAAGRGTRFGAASKMLAEFDGKPLVRHVAEAALAAGLRPVLTVLGYEAATVQAALAGLDLAIVLNPAYAEGQATSLRAGFSALPSEAEAALVLLGDMPLIRPDLIASLAAAWMTLGRPAALIPSYAGRRGNPVVLSRALAPEIARLVGDTGAGPLLRGRTDVVEHAVDDPAVTADVDTSDALAALGGGQASTTPSRMAM